MKLVARYRWRDLMKNSFLVLMVIFVMSGCNKPDEVGYPRLSGRLFRNKIGKHEYIGSINGGVVHAADCPCLQLNMNALKKPTMDSLIPPPINTTTPHYWIKDQKVVEVVVDKEASLHNTNEPWILGAGR